MNRDRNALKAGIFIVFSFVAAVLAVLLIRGDGGGPSHIHTVVFSLTDDLGGLTVGDDVRIGGVKVGTVRDIVIDSGTSSPRVHVRFSVPTSYSLHKDAKLTIQTALTGPPNLNITALGTADLLGRDEPLEGNPDPKSSLIASLTRSAPHIEAIVTDLELETLPKLNSTVDSTKDLVRHVDKKVDPLAARADEVAGRASTVLADVNDLIGDGKSTTDLRGTIKNLNLTTATLRDKLPTMLDWASTVVDKVNAAMSKVTGSLDDLQKTISNARDLTASARSIVTDNQGRLEGIIKSAKTTADNLKATSVEVRHSPWRLLYRPSAEEMGNLTLYDSAREFAEGAGNLSDASLALRDALKDPNANKAQIEKLSNNLDDCFKRFQLAEDKLWTSVRQ